MIDRKTFWTVIALVAIMLAMAAWRVSLLADWTQLPRFGVNGEAIAPINPAILLVGPAMILFLMARLTWRERTARDPGENLRPWKKWTSIMLVPISVITMLAEAFTITRSLGLLAISPILVARVLLVVAGLLGIVIGNSQPKLPWLQSRIAFFNLHPDRGARFLRFSGWIGVLSGLTMVLCGLFVPSKVMAPVIYSLGAIVVVLTVFFRFSGQRGQPQ